MYLHPLSSPRYELCFHQSHTHSLGSWVSEDLLTRCISGSYYQSNISKFQLMVVLRSDY
jgi:hypothetical protein